MSTKLPPQVQAQADEVERIEQEMAAEVAVPQDPPTPVPEPTPEPPAPAPPEPKPEDDVWRNRYLTLKGMFDAEVPRLQSENKELKASLTDLNAKVDALSKAPPEPRSRLVTEKDTEAFGEDLVDLAKRVATEVVEEREAKLKDEIERLSKENGELKTQFTGVTEKQEDRDRVTYFAELKRLVPNYETLNTDEGFVSWLAEVDALSNLPRQVFLNDAYQKMDVSRTATLFNTYTKSAEPAPPLVDPELSRQVAPGTSKSTTTPTDDPALRIFSTADVEVFYRDVSKGAYRGRDAERVRLEAEIEAAAATGRVR